MKLNINNILICMILITIITGALMLILKKDDEFRTDFNNESMDNDIPVIKEYSIEIIDKDTNIVLETKKIKENDNLIKPEIIEKDGYTFKYFSDINGNEINFNNEVKVTSDMKIYMEYILGKVMLEEIKVKEELNIKLNETCQIEYEVVPNYANNKNIVYSTTNRYTVAVDETGGITGKRTGICYITMLDKVTNISKRIKVIVK